jgi:adenosylcobyric acid synthase
LKDVAARSLFIGGTSSNSGKSWVATAACAFLRRQGISVAPFKAQNMSNNSFPCADGGEIGRAQVAQAEACGLSPETAMNPILLKPNGDGTSQVIVRGRVWKTLQAREYYEHFDTLLVEVLAAYDELARRFDVVIIEGAGSVSELNLRHHDLVNLGLATRVRAPWVLVADIDRGGVFASIVGTVALLTPDERRLFRGFLINKFRGDRTLFDSGVDLLEARTDAPCLGVFPFDGTLTLDAEDSLALDVSPRSAPPAGARVAILHFPRVSNATDFRLIDWAHWISTPSSARYDFVILPGSKHTVADLEWLRERRLDAWILDQHRNGATVIGVCGGFQMLGETIADPSGMESAAGDVRGLGLLPVDTTLAAEKTTRVRRGITSKGIAFSAYEIHLGVTTGAVPLPPFATLDDGSAEGIRTERVIGTYLHGAFEDASVCSEMFGVPVGPAASKESQHAGLADWLQAYARQTDRWLF